MTAPDLCRLASAAFPGLTFEPIDLGSRTISARSPELRVIHSIDADAFAVALRGDRFDYRSDWHDTIEAAHADALAVKAEYEPEPAKTTAPAEQLPLFG